MYPTMEMMTHIYGEIHVWHPYIAHRSPPFASQKAPPSDPVLLETNHSEIVPNRAKDSHRPADRPAGHETSLLGTSE